MKFGKWPEVQSTLCNMLLCCHTSHHTLHCIALCISSHVCSSRLSTSLNNCLLEAKKRVLFCQDISLCLPLLSLTVLQVEQRRDVGYSRSCYDRRERNSFEKKQVVVKVSNKIPLCSGNLTLPRSPSRNFLQSERNRGNCNHTIK